MSRPAAIQRPIKLTTALPADVHERLMRHLRRSSDGQVPCGAISAFLVRLIVRELNSSQ